MELNQTCRSRIRTGFRIVASVCLLLLISRPSLYAQGDRAVLQKKINLQLTQVTIADVLTAIGNQASCRFSYSSNQVNAGKIVSVNYRELSVENAVKQLLGEQLKRLRVSGNQVFIQTGNEKGRVKGLLTTADGKPAAGVSVLLSGTPYAVVSGEAGEYYLEAPEGNYELEVSFVGLQTHRQSVTIHAGKVATADFTLDENSGQLQEIVVTTGRHNRFAAKGSVYVAKLSLKNLENPQSYSSLTKELLTEQLITDVSDGLKNTPGAIKMQASIGRSGDGAVYYNLRGFPTKITMVDGIPAQTNGDVDPAYLERIEVIRGPSGTLYGGALTTFGGLINTVSKKPLDTTGGELSYTAGSFNLSRLTADVYGAINKNKTLTARMNIAYHKRNSFQDAGFRQSTLIAPVIEYQVNEKLKLNLGAEFYQYEGTNASIVFLARTRQFYARTPDELHFDWKRSYTSNDITLKAPASNVHGKIEYRINQAWIAQTNFSRNIRKTDGMYQYEFIRGNTSDELLERNVQSQNSEAASTSLQQNFTGDFNVGSLRNRIIIGLDYLNQSATNTNSPIVKFDTLNGTQYEAKYAGLSQSRALAKIAANTGAPTRNASSGNIYSIYASDVVNITSRLLAMLSVRVDYFDSKGTTNLATNTLLENSRFNQTAVSPKFGLVYQLVKDQVSLFGNYMNGFSNVEPVSQPLPDISGNFKPQQANQFEGGVKLDVLAGKISLTTSYYNIKVKNITRDEALVRNGTEYTIKVQNGTQFSEGVELDMVANPLSGLNVIAGYSYNKSILTRSAKELEGRRPSSAGPANLLNAWVSYAFPAGCLKGFGLGAGGNYVSEHVTVNSATTGIFTFPAYTLLNAAIFYDAKTFRIGCKLDNITDALYFTGQGVLSPQMGRNFSANLTVRF